jgi:glycogen synthase
VRISRKARHMKPRGMELPEPDPTSMVMLKGPDFASVRDPELLRDLAWQIAAAHPQDAYAPAVNYVTLAMAGPRQGLATWRVLPNWIQSTGEKHGDAWNQRRLVLRLYDVTLVKFDGFNAHRIVDLALDSFAGERLFGLDAAGTVELAEVGFLLPHGEFVPAARSQPVQFPSGAAAAEYDPSALFVDAELRPEPVPTPWESGRWLKRHGLPELRSRLRVAVCAFESSAVGDAGSSAAFVGELTRGLAEQGHEVHVLLPRKHTFGEDRRVGGVAYHPIEISGDTGDPVEISQAYGRAAQACLAALGRFDLRHAHEWMAGEALGTDGVKILSLSSTEATRLGSSLFTDLSQRIRSAEQAVARAADCVLVPETLHERALAELRLSSERLLTFPLEGRMLDEWESPLDLGQVKCDIGLGSLDRVFLFVGPLEWSAGPDLLVEALPPLLHRHQNCRLVFVGLGGMQGHMEYRARELGVSYAVRWLGHLEGYPLIRVLRAAEAVVLPSRQHGSFEEGVVTLARRAKRAVITTHSGPSHLVVHDQNGLVTYDNPGSMVWAIGQLLGDPEQAESLGTTGRTVDSRGPSWTELVANYTDLCAELFPELTESPE